MMGRKLKESGILETKQRKFIKEEKVIKCVKLNRQVK